VQTDLIDVVARERVRDLLRDAKNRRALRAGLRLKKRPLRHRLAVAIRAMGYVALSLGDALAESQ
jgi:hypothetical protein